jgi:hypothetical protein
VCKKIVSILKMTKQPFSTGVVHSTPSDLKFAILSINEAHIAWEDITPLARNEWICWVEAAKKPITRSRRIKRTRSELIKGKRRPCCWAGCVHRNKAQTVAKNNLLV